MDGSLATEVWTCSRGQWQCYLATFTSWLTCALRYPLNLPIQALQSWTLIALLEVFRQNGILLLGSIQLIAPCPFPNPKMPIFCHNFFHTSAFHQVPHSVFLWLLLSSSACPTVRFRLIDLRLTNTSQCKELTYKHYFSFFTLPWIILLQKLQKVLDF